MRDRLDLHRSLDHGGGHERGETSPGHRVVVDVHDVDGFGSLEPCGHAEYRLHVRALGRIELDGDDPLAGLEPFLEQRPAQRRPWTGDDLALDHEERHARLAALLHGGVNGGDLRRRRPAAAADQQRTLAAGLGRELSEVVGSRVRVDDAPAGAAREADVRLGAEREAVRVLGHLREGGQRGLWPEAAVRPDDGDIDLLQPLDRLAGVDARQGLAVLVEGELRDDRKGRDIAHRADRRFQLVEVVERLDEEEVDAATLEKAGLLAEDLEGALGADRVLKVSERPDRRRRQAPEHRRSRALPGPA